MADIRNAMVAIEQIAPHPRNFRNHPPEQLEQLKASHQRFDQYRSVVLWEQQDGSYIQVAGHGIVMAMRERGVRAVRADILPVETSPADVEGILAADNLLPYSSTDDEEILARLLQEQLDAGYDLAALGSDEETLRGMWEELGTGELEAREAGRGGDDYGGDPDAMAVRCKRGELWQLGEHRLLVGDSTDVLQVQRLMQGERALCCWTDPPYGVSYVGKTKEALTIENDGKMDLDSLLERAFAVMDVVLTDGASIYVAHPAGALSVTFGVRFLRQGWRLHQTLVWVKDSMVLGHSDYHYRHEPILFGYKPGEGRQGRGGEGWYGDNSQTSVFEVPRPKRSEEHPTMKPVELIEEMLMNSCPAGGLIYEPFAGSGSTMIAAHRLRMRCYMVELDPRYATVILDRYEAETGEAPVLLEALGPVEGIAYV